MPRNRFEVDPFFFWIFFCWKLQDMCLHVCEAHLCAYARSWLLRVVALTCWRQHATQPGTDSSTGTTATNNNNNKWAAMQLQQKDLRTIASATASHENPSESRRNIRVTTSFSSSLSLAYCCCRLLVVVCWLLVVAIVVAVAVAAGRHCCKDLRKVYSPRHLLWLL